MSLLKSSHRPRWSNAMQKWKRVMKEGGNIALANFLDHGVPLQQASKMEGQNIFLLCSYFYYY